MGGLDRRGGHLRSVTAVVAVMFASVAACGGGEDDRLPPPRSPQPTPVTASSTLSLTPEEQQAVDEVRALFDEFMNAYVELATSGEVPNEHPAYRTLDQHGMFSGSGFLSEVVDNWRAGHAADGPLTWTYVGVTAIDLDHVAPGDISNPLVDLVYCIDATSWSTIDRATGERVGDVGGRTLWTIRGGWLADRGGPDSDGWSLGSAQDEEAQC